MTPRLTASMIKATRRRHPKPAGARGLQMQPHWPPEPKRNFNFLAKCWSGRRDSNPRPRPWQGRALPLSYTRVFNRLLAGIRTATGSQSSKPDPLAAQRRLFKEFSRRSWSTKIQPSQWRGGSASPFISNDRSAGRPARAAVVQPIGGSHCRSRDYRRGR